MTAYSLKLRYSPEWKALRQRLYRDRNYTCEDCGRTGHKLNLHHKYYQSKREPWDYPDDCFKVLCEECHEHTTEALSSLLYTLGSFSGDQLVDVQCSLQVAVSTHGAQAIGTWLVIILESYEDTRVLMEVAS